MPDGQMTILGIVRWLGSFMLSLGIYPSESDHRRRSQREAGVVQNRSPLKIGLDDRFDMNQPGAAIHRQP